MNRICHIILIIVVASCLHGQSPDGWETQTERGWISMKSWLRAADSSMDNKDYYDALRSYLQVLKFDTSDVHVLYKTAEAARLFSAFAIAEEKYEEVLNLDDNLDYPLSSFWLANMAQMRGDYQKAMVNYNIYLSEHGGDNRKYTDLARKELASCDWSVQLFNQPQENVTITRLGEDINSRHSDFGGILETNGLSFSSLRFDRESTRGPLGRSSRKYPQNKISKILRQIGSQPVQEYAEYINRDTQITAHTAYNINRSRVYYTICEYLNGYDIRCDIYYRPIMGDGTLGNKVKLPKKINHPDSTNTQPNIGFDSQSGKEVLYFVSNREGGQGKLDIWYAFIEGVDSFSSPMNLVDLNTPENDITPFFHNNSQVLHFSSQGYTSLGGYDVYRTTKEGGKFVTPENMGVPINSSFNDIYYTLSEDGSGGLFSSDRDGSTYRDENTGACCFDIYNVEIGELEINLIALTFDGRTLDSLAGARVTLIDVSENAEVGTVLNELSNEHIFQLERGKEYMIISEKEGYKTDSSRFNTHRVYKSEDIVRQIYLQPLTVELQVLTYDEISREPLPGSTVTVVDLTDSDVTPSIKTNPSGNDFYFEIIPGHQYRIRASRDRYDDEIIEFTAEDPNGTGLVVKRLYLKRRDLNIFLPLTVYFNNDRPGEKTMALNTSLTYMETFDEYVLQKNKFKEEYAGRLRGQDRIEAEQLVESFFQDEVKGGFDQLHLFLNAMLEQLKEGKIFDLSIRGFASPRADSKYNLALGQRRVKSMQNELRAYENGAFIPFIQNGQLKITELSYGENLAPDTISDEINDQRNSIYSPEASRERRVEIVEIKTQNPNNGN